MQEYPRRQETQTPELISGSHTRQWLAVATILLLVRGLEFEYGHRQHARANQMSSQAEQMGATIDQLQAQVNSLNSKLNDMSATTAAVAPFASVPIPVIAASKTKHVVTSVRQRPPEEKWLLDHPRFSERAVKGIPGKSDSRAIVDPTRTRLSNWRRAHRS
jgi:outer membrane murein-binding lipoprotein Lpp